LILAVRNGQSGAVSVFGFVARKARKDREDREDREDRAPANRAINVARAIDTIRGFGLVIVVVTVSLASPRPGTDGARNVAIAVVLALSTAAWIAWLLSGTTGDRRALSLGSLVVMGAAGGVLAGLSPNSPAVAVGCAACFSAGVRLRTELSLAIVAETVAGFLIAGLVAGAPAGALLGYTFAFAGLWSVALTRRQFAVRAEQAEQMLAETRRAREAETHAAALAERARIARDIHDVLAHSLAAVSVNLQAAEGLLTAESLPADNPELAKAIECIDRAGTLTREGLAAARRAILALRDDAAPLPDQLASLAAQYQAAGDAQISLTVTGAPRPLSEQSTQVAYRTAQEGLTNARKHAPGQPVTLALAFEPGQVTVTVENPLPPDGQPSPLAHTGAGAGLTGLKERAALAGGTLEAGPAGGIWRIGLTIPA
jgi:signal transduction histidine kinase